AVWVCGQARGAWRPITNSGSRGPRLPTSPTAPGPPGSPPTPPPPDGKTQRARGAPLSGGGGCFSNSDSSSNLWAVTLLCLSKMSRRAHRQLSLPKPPTWGGPRENSGRKPTGQFGYDHRGRPQSGANHGPRPDLNPRHPPHLAFGDR